MGNHLTWISLGLILLGAMALRTFVRRRRETRGLRALAKGRGLTFSGEDLIGIHERYHALELIRQGHGRIATDVVYGTTPQGLLTLFRYEYELGFGSQRAIRQWWISVLETPAVHDHVQGAPVDAAPAWDGAEQIGAFRVRSRHPMTMERLRKSGIADFLASLPPGGRWEARAHLVAVALPPQAGPGRAVEDVFGLVAVLSNVQNHDAANGMMHPEAVSSDRANPS